MGTRHLIAVHSDGEYKVAQYGQWDGYPEGAGLDVLNFLHTDKVTKLKENLKRVRFLDEEGRDKELVEGYNSRAPKWSNEPDNRTEEEKYWWGKYMSRDVCADILHNVADSNDDEILLNDSIDFVKDSLFCEWAYVVDFDKNTFEIYSGFNKAPLTEDERFFEWGVGSDDPADNGYEPVRHLITYSLDKLPTSDEYLTEFRVMEGDEE